MTSPCPAGGRRGSCQSTGLLGPAQGLELCGWGEWRGAEAVMCLQHPRATCQQSAGWLILAGQLPGSGSGSGSLEK